MLMQPHLNSHQTLGILMFAFLVSAFGVANIQAQTDSSCDREAGSRSAETTQAAKIILTNQTNEVLSVYWLNFRGRRQKWFDLVPGQTFDQPTYVGHLWLVAKSNGQCVHIFSAPGQFAIGQSQRLADAPRQSQSQTQPTPQANKSTVGSAEDYVAQGNKYRAAEQYASAIEAYKKALALDPSIGDAHYSLGYSYYLLKQYQNALPAFQEAVRLKPSESSRHYWLGATYFRLQRYQEALTSLQESLRLKPDDPYSHHWLGDVYAEGFKQYEKAILEYRESVRLQPDYAIAHNQLGLAYVELEQLEDALAAFKDAVRLKPREGLYHSNTGMTYVRMGMKEQALDTQRMLQTIDTAKAKELGDYIAAIFPTEFEDKSLLSYAVLTEAVNPAAALPLYRRVLLLKPNPEELARTYCGMGDAYKALQKSQQAQLAYQQAIRLYQQLIPRKPQEAHLHYFLGHAYLGLGQRERALQISRTLQRIDPKKAQELLAEINKAPGAPPATQTSDPASQPAARRGASGTPSEAGRRDSATPSTDNNVNDLSGRSPVPTAPPATNSAVGPARKTAEQLINEAGEILISNSTRAMALLKQALRTNPTDTDVNNAAFFMTEMGKYAEALPIYQRVIAKRPADKETLASAYWGLGTVYSHMGQPQKALDAYLQMNVIDPDLDLAVRAIDREYFEAKNFKDDAVLLEQAVKLKPKSADLNWRLGKTYLWLNMLDKALVYLKEAVRLDPKIDFGQYLLGEALLESNHYAESAAAFSEAVKQDPKSAEALFGLGQAFVKMGNVSQAQRVHAQLQRLDPKKAQELLTEINKRK